MRHHAAPAARSENCRADYAPMKSSSRYHWWEIHLGVKIGQNRPLGSILLNSLLNDRAVSFWRIVGLPSARIQSLNPVHEHTVKIVQSDG